MSNGVKPLFHHETLATQGCAAPLFMEVRLGQLRIINPEANLQDASQTMSTAATAMLLSTPSAAL